MNEIGEILKQARIEKGYTLDDLQQTTKIQKRYLEAIEEGNIEILPGRFYARAFVKQYADNVGLDGEQLLEEHLNETSKQASEEFAENVNVSPTRSTQGKRSGVLSTLQENLPTILIVFIVIAIFGVIYMAWRQADGANQSENSLINEDNTEEVAPPVTEESNEEAATEEEPEVEEEPETPEAQEITVAESTGSETTFEVAGPHPEEQTVVLSASGGKSWVSITVAGGETQAQLLEDGDELSVTFGPDVTQVDLVIGYSPATNITLNETAVEYAPEAEDSITQTLQLQFTE